MVLKTQGIVIKKRDLKDADRLLTIYTKDFGKVLVKARAVKKSSAKLKGHLELFVHSHIMIAQGKSLDVIVGAETIKSYPVLHSNLESLTVAYYFAELIDKLVAGSEKDENIWQMMLISLGTLNDLRPRTDLLVKAFENKLLECLGYDLKEESQSGQQKRDALTFIQQELGERINAKQFLSL